MKNILVKWSLDQIFVKFIFYSLLFTGIASSLFLIFQGFSDPFGEFLIIGGFLSLILFPSLLTFFILILSKISHDKAKRKNKS
jgi:hypothetical protein